MRLRNKGIFSLSFLLLSGNRRNDFETPDEDGFFSIDLIGKYTDGIAGRYAVNA